MSDQFQWWRDALAGKKPAIYDSHPQSGYFKTRMVKGGPWVPALIADGDNGEKVCRIGNERFDANEKWIWLAKNPVSQADARAAFTTGAWPGDDGPVAAQSIGANGPPSEITELIPMEITAADDWLAKIKTIATQEQSDIASNKVATLRGLKKQADAAHETEKAPHLAAGRAVDEKYNPKIKDIAEAVRRLLAAVTIFQNAEKVRLQKIADEAARVENEKRRAEFEKKVADELARAAESRASNKAEPAFVPPSPPALVEAAPVKIKSGGAMGRTVGLRKVKFATIHDFDKALMALKGHKEIVELVNALANRAAKAGIPLEGVEFGEREEAA